MLHSKSITILLLSFISIFMFFNLELAHSSSFTGYETQIFHESNEAKVKKLQEVFKGCGLYDGEVSGIFDDIKEHLISYQIKKGIISNSSDDGAGYFGAKTMKALEEDFGEIYLQLKEDFLKVDEPINSGHFQITAYYTPVQGQQKYTTGSFAGDVKLNGNNTTASGIPLQPGMLAAPRNYPFGTKIYIEGIGIGIVGDRGGAIVNAGERGHSYDRLDIWVGYGDEGRERARQWGRRDIPGYIVDDTYEVNVEFDESPISKYSNLSINPNDIKVDDVVKLQELFKGIGLYDGEIDGIWNSIKDTFINYQISRGIITSTNDSAAGYFGPKTYKKLQDEFGTKNGLFVEKYIDEKNNQLTEEKTPPDTYDSVLTNKEKTNLHTLRNILQERLEKMSKGNEIKYNELVAQFKIILNEVTKMDKYLNRKYEFQYLIEIM